MCPCPVAFTDLPRLPGQSLDEFDDFGVFRGSFWAQRWMPEATLTDHGASHAKCSEKGCQNCCPGSHLEAHWGSGGCSGGLGHSLHVTLATAGSIFDDLFGKVEI